MKPEMLAKPADSLPGSGASGLLGRAGERRATRGSDGLCEKLRMWQGRERVAKVPLWVARASST